MKRGNTEQASSSAIIRTSPSKRNVNGIVTKEDVILETSGIIKEFSGVRVLDQVDFDLKYGEVHALVGENGAGKSTFIKILTGVYTKDGGEILVDNREAVIRNRHDAATYGIATVFQEFSLVPTLSIAENMYVGHWPVVPLLGGIVRIVNWKAMIEEAVAALEDFGVHVDPRLKTRRVGVAVQQLIEIAKALSMNTRILILDEPTAALSSAEIKHLFSVLQSLKKKGVSIIYISHRLNEVNVIGDRVTVLKDGKKVGTVPIVESSTDKIVRMMVGRELGEVFPSRKTKRGKPLLTVENLTFKDKVKEVSFQVHAGEILGITGLIGSGKTELAHALFGINKTTSGALYVDGKLVRISSPRQAKSLGLGFLPEDRQHHGVIMALTTAENITLPNLKQFSKYGIVWPSLENKIVTEYIQLVRIKPADPKRRVRFLSGGNQQKVVLSKWLCSKSRLYIFDEPTRGIDVGSKIEIYDFMASLADSGCGVIMISSELPEILGLSDRIIVLYNGKISAVMSSEEASSERVFQASIGNEILSEKEK